MEKKAHSFERRADTALARNVSMVRQINLTNFLSFGPRTQSLELENLNVLIGPNASGKSNLIEALALMRATPFTPQTTVDADLWGVIRSGGGPGEWVWKGQRGQAAQVEMVFSYPRSRLELGHRLAFRGDDDRFRIDDEQIDKRVDRRDPLLPPSPKHIAIPKRDPLYSFNRGRPVIYRRGAKNSRRQLDFQMEPDLSILAQLRDPSRYPEISYLGKNYETWRIYREWEFGRDTICRSPQRADVRNDRLEEDFYNLGIFLSRLRKTPSTKKALLDALRGLYQDLTDFEVVAEGGSVQVFFHEREFDVSARRLSDGTLRYLCLVAILCDPEPPPLVCIEEPELGLHPDVLPKLADLLLAASQRMQIVVTTHSDILVDAMTDCPQSVVVFDKHDGQTEMRRLNKDDLGEWLTRYRLGELWTKGEIGGTRW